MNGAARIRIGELSRRVGASPELLRAWETRYGLLAPERTPGGLRLYSEADERRVRLMQQHIAAGLPASEAARLARLADEAAPGAQPGIASGLLAGIRRDLEALDEGSAQAALDQVLNTLPLEVAVGEVILPLLRALGDDWEQNRLSVAQEHFATNVVGGRLRALSRSWGQGVGPCAILACPPGERHELGLVCFGLLLRRRGWRIAYIGAETPIADIGAELDALRAAIIVFSAVSEQPFRDSERELAELARHARVAIGGAGASAALAEALGTEWLGGELLTAAAELTP